MEARALFEEGRLDEAIAALGVELRSHPTDTQRRVFLFELLCFLGDYDRAEKHLDVLAAGGRDAGAGTLVYRSAIHAERIRRDMFATGDYPRSESGPTELSGTLNGKPFQSLADADPRIGARLEVFAAGQYTWIPFAQLATVRMGPPQRLRDLLWAPAVVRTGAAFKGVELGEVLLPVLAPGTADADDASVRLGRATEWVRWEDGTEAPLGQKLLLVNGEEFPLLELRNLDIAPAQRG